MIRVVLFTLSLWRNRLARSAVNRKVGGSSPPSDAFYYCCYFFLFVRRIIMLELFLVTTIFCDEM